MCNRMLGKKYSYPSSDLDCEVRAEVIIPLLRTQKQGSDYP